jgi:hypothetical protein
MGREVSNGIVDFCTCINDALRMVGESRKMDAILLTLEFLCVLAFLAVVDLERVVVACYNREFARVVKVEGGDRRRARTRGLEALDRVSTSSWSEEEPFGLTLEGRKLAMTSPTFCVGGPAGGGGAPGVPEPAAMVRSMFATSCRQPTASPRLGDSAQLAAVDVRAVGVFTRAPVTNLDPAECANQWHVSPWAAPVPKVGASCHSFDRESHLSQKDDSKASAPASRQHLLPPLPSRSFSPLFYSCANEHAVTRSIHTADFSLHPALFFP